MKLQKKTILLGLGGILLGAAIVLGIRFATYHEEKVHYHANFAVYIDGKREEFKNPIYYTDTACSLETEMTPQERAHMHDNVNDVVHVEDYAVTWGQFFDNLGWYVGPNFIAKSDGTIYQSNDTAKLNVLINGEDYTGLGALTNRVIGDKDKVLISYGNESQKDLNSQYKTIASTAGKYNTTQDPASCGGSHETTLSERLKHLF